MIAWKGQSAWSIADNFAQQALSFAIFAVLAHWLTPHEFGLLAIAHLMVQFVRMTLLDAIAMPVVRGVDSNDALFDWLFTLCTIVSLVLAAVMALASPLLVRFFGTPELMPVLLGMSLVIVLFGLVRAHEARLLREGNFRLLAIRSLCSVSAGGVVALLMVYQGAGAMALVAQQLVAGVVALLIAVAAEWRTWRPRWSWSTALIRRHASEMNKVSASALLNYANTSGDAALVTVLLGPYATGLYNLAKRVLSAAYLVIGASLGRVSVSLFVQQQRDPAALRQIYGRMLAMTLLLLAPVYTIVTALAEPMVVIVFGEKWRASAALFGWLSVAYMGQAVFALGQNLSFATGQTSRVPKLALAQMLLATTLAWVLARTNGATGVAAGFALGSVAGMVAMKFAIGRQLGMSLRSFVVTILPAGAGAALSAILIHLLPLTGMDVTEWSSLIIAGMTGLVAYGAGAGAVRRLAGFERGSSGFPMRRGLENRAPGEDERTGKVLGHPS
ncbi:MAG: oligosaccharide flippase family protein [Thiobacillus sp.]|uniref:oligosaccharide flippase family protein n=1 Tax=Thiobacillus sp. TaxID=924 RepID=UPI00168C3330|nr:oligosaccharide flippase family protein [Thiobacillus sp.]QLQ01557.1 MAG: oligosaccharide flippase family protein [Thiobacillus sp.]